MQTLIKIAIKAAGALRATCLIAGITVMLIVVLEASIRVYAVVKPWVAPRVERLVHGRRPEPVVPQPAGYWDVYKHPDYFAELNTVRHLTWEPYVYTRSPRFSGVYINTDSIGRRVTPQPVAPPANGSTTDPRTLKVFLMGASTMWGYGQRDAHTIAAEVSRHLQSIVVPGERIEIVNESQIGYVMTQSVLTLLLELRDGNRPDIVVFFDGSNDVAAAMQAGVAGIPQNEFKRAADFKMGRALDHHAYDSGLRKDVTALAILFGQALDQFDLFDAVKSLARPPARPQQSPEQVARDIARRYVDNARLVAEWGRSNDFIPIFVWPPAVQTTQKRLTAAETYLVPPHPEKNAYFQVHRMLPGILDSMMTSVAGARFVNESGLFKGDSMPMFLDGQGHQTELATPGIAEGIWPVLRSAVIKQRARAASSQLAGATTRPARERAR